MCSAEDERGPEAAPRFQEREAKAAVALARKLAGILWAVDLRQRPFAAA